MIIFHKKLSIESQPFHKLNLDQKKSNSNSIETYKVKKKISHVFKLTLIPGWYANLQNHFFEPNFLEIIDEYKKNLNENRQITH